jgi:hypothetical protein
MLPGNLIVRQHDLAIAMIAANGETFGCDAESAAGKKSGGGD